MAKRRYRKRNFSSRSRISSKMLPVYFVGFIFLMALANADKLYDIFGVLMCFSAIFIMYKLFGVTSNHYKTYMRFKYSNVEEVDRMSGHDFEHFLAPLFEHAGYKATVTKGSGDFGADLILKNGRKKYVVQAKCYSSNIGVSAIQEVVGAINYYKANGAMVVTNQYFTKQAETLAKANKVRLINRTELADMISKFNRKHKYKLLEVEAN
jgi:restriction system protein